MNKKLIWLFILFSFLYPHQGFSSDPYPCTEFTKKFSAYLSWGLVWDDIMKKTFDNNARDFNVYRQKYGKLIKINYNAITVSIGKGGQKLKIPEGNTLSYEAKQILPLILKNWLDVRFRYVDIVQRRIACQISRGDSLSAREMRFLKDGSAPYMNPEFLRLAIEYVNPKAIKILLNLGTDLPTYRSGSNNIHRVLYRRQPKLYKTLKAIELLVSAGVDINESHSISFKLRRTYRIVYPGTITREIRQNNGLPPYYHRLGYDFYKDPAVSPPINYAVDFQGEDALELVEFMVELGARPFFRPIGGESLATAAIEKISSRKRLDLCPVLYYLETLEPVTFYLTLGSQKALDQCETASY